MAVLQTKPPSSRRRLGRVLQDLSFELIRSPKHWRRRSRELNSIEPRRVEIEAELSEQIGRPIQLASVGTCRSYDEVFFAMAGRERVGVVRVNSLAKAPPDEAEGPDDLALPLLARERLDREWDAYCQLAPAGLAPKPLWRADDAIACAWVRWPRMSDLLIADRSQVWSTLDRALPAIRQMHALGVTHLDMNPGNVLLSPRDNTACLIDFEFGPAPWLSVDGQKAYDYLRIVNECLRPRRGGQYLASDPGRLAEMLNGHACEQARIGELPISDRHLRRITEQPQLQKLLQEVFTGLR